MTVLTIISIILIESATAAFSFKFNLFGKWPIEIDFSSKEIKKIKKLKKMIAENKTYCVRDDFEEVLEDENLMNYMIDEICTKVPRSEATNYIKNTYGIKTKHLGSGSFGDVFSYTEDGNEESLVTAAIKKPKSFIYKQMFFELNASECIKKSVDDTKLHHYGIIKECIWPEGDETPFLVMDYYRTSFEDFLDSLDKKKWKKMGLGNQKRALNKMILITEELKDLHEHGIAHRDLKPANIMMDDNDNPVLVDFGMTSPLGAEITKRMSGTPTYLDYEILFRKSIPIASDIYALCIIFAQIYLGKFAKLNIRSMNDVNTIKYYYVNSTKYKFDRLNAPTPFQWTWNMFKTTKDGRWKAQKVLDELIKMKNKLDLQERLLI